MRILLVAGHGDGDPGACANGYKESELTRDFVDLLIAHLSQYAQVDIFDTSKNMYRYLKSGRTFNFSPYDYILEIHFNAGGGAGTEILVHTNQKGISVEEKIVNSIATTGLKNRGVKRSSNLGNMNRLFKQGKDYALLEICFIDSVEDMKNYSNNAAKIAKAVSDGIVNGFGLSQIETSNKPSDTNREITSPNDIVWELSQRIEISDIKKAVNDLTTAKKENSSCYWMLKKLANKH